MFFVLSKAVVRRVIAETIALLCCLESVYLYVLGDKRKGPVNQDSYQQVKGVDWVDVEGGTENILETNQNEQQAVWEQGPYSPKKSPAASAPTLSPRASNRGPRSIRTRRRVRFTPAVEEIVGFAFSKSDYDRTVIQTDKPKQTEDVLTWISSALQNNTNEVTKNEKQFLCSNVLTLYDTDFSDYESSLRDCVVQFVLREVAIKESALLKLKLCRDSLCNTRHSTDAAAEECREALLRLVNAHIHTIETLTPWDSDSYVSPPQPQIMQVWQGSRAIGACG